MKKNSLILFILFIILLFIPLSLQSQETEETQTQTQISPKTPPSDTAFLQAFTAQKRNLNRLNLPTLRRFFRLIRINTKKAERLYKMRKKHRFRKFEELKKVGLTNKEIILLRRYLILTPVSAKSILRLKEIIDSDDAQLMDYYRDFLVHPVSLNNADACELMELPHMDPSKLSNILQARRASELVTLESLTNFGWTISELEWIRPFVSLRPRRQEYISASLDILFKQISQDLTRILPVESSNSREFQIKTFIESKHFRIFAGVRNFDMPFFLDDWNHSLSNGTFNLSIYSTNIELTVGHFELRTGQGLLFGSLMTLPPDDVQGPPFYHKDRGLKASSSLSPDLNGDGMRDSFTGFSISLHSKQARFLHFRPDANITGFTSFQSNTQLQEVGLNLSTALPLTIPARIGLNFLSSFPKNSASFYYDTFPLPFLQIYGEGALQFSNQERAFFQGIRLRTSNIKSSLALYLISTNFEAPHGCTLPHGRKDTAGGIFGLKWKNPSGHFLWIADLYSKTSSPAVKKNLTFRYDTISISPPIIKKLRASIKMRYSDDTDDQSLRNSLTCILNPTRKTAFTLQYQNLIALSTNLSGHRLALRFGINLTPALTLQSAASIFDSPDSSTALYGVELQTVAGESGIIRYNGKGMEAALLIRWKIFPNLKIHARYIFVHNDKDDVINNSHKIGIYIQGNLI